MQLLALESRYVNGWPDNDDDRCGLTDAHEILTTRYDTDVHFTAYRCAVERRHTSGSLARADEAGVVMVAAVFDVDGPGHEGSDEWWKGEGVNKLGALIIDHPGAFIYRTRGGYRIVYALPEPVPIRTTADADAWTRRYVGWCRHLESYGITPDRTCKTWTRLFRAPHTTRDGVVQELETIGDPAALGVWAPNLAKEDDAPEAEPAPATRESLPGAPSRGARIDAAARLLGDAWPSEGRHGAQLALAGALARDGWKEARALEFLCAVCRRAGNEERSKREQTIQRTYKLLAQGRPVSGWTALESHVEPGIAKAARDLLDADADAKREMQAEEAAPAETDDAEEAHFSDRIKRGADWDEPYVRPPYLLDGLIPHETVCTFFAEGGSVKSWTALALAIAVATDTPWLGLRVTPGKVLILDFEDGWAEFRRRKEILAPPGADLSQLEYLYCGPNIADRNLWLWLENQGYALLVIDALSSGMPSDADENDQRFAEGLKMAGKFVSATGCNVLAVHHANKSGGIRGSSAIRDQSDLVFQFEPVSETDNVKRMRMRCDKPGPQKRPAPVNVELNDKGLTTFKDEAAEAMRNAFTHEDVVAAIRLALANGPIASIGKLQAATNKGQKRVEETLEELMAEGEVVNLGSAKRPSYALDSDERRRARVIDIVRRLNVVTPGEIATHAVVDTKLVDLMRLEGVIAQSAEGRWLVVNRE